MDRILSSASADLKVTLYVDGVATDATGTPTVTITRGDGTALISNAATTKVAGTTGQYAYTLTPAQTATLDRLTAKWTATLAGVAGQVFTTHAEVVGGFLFSTADARKLKPLDNTTTYPTADVQAARTLAEDALEHACGVAFVPRYFRETLDGNGNTDLLLASPRPLSVTAATVDGTAVDTTTLKLYEAGWVYNPDGWTAGRQNVVITGTAGYESPPPRVGRAALLLAKRWLVDTPINDRATQLVNSDGTTQWFVTAGVRSAVFDIPEANAVVEDYGVRYSVG